MADENLFGKLVLEAVEACGADVAAIEAFVQQRLGTLDAGQRAAIQRDIERVLSFREPPGPPYQVN